LTLNFVRDGGETRLRIQRQDPPWKVVRAFGPLVHLHNVSGGVLAGDRLALEISVEPGASAQITTTGATRLYRHRLGAVDSEQQITISVGENGLLEYLPDAVIPFGGSRHTQRTAISLAAGATLFWQEIFAPGRQAMGERFAFERLRIESDVRAEGRQVLRESFLLDPDKRPPGAMARMGDHSHMASFYILKAGEPPRFWRDLEATMSEISEAIQRTNGGIWGATTLISDGVLVRGLTATIRAIPAALLEFWRAARLRITGEEAVPPRKVR
jgi:urease accessory protein